MHSFMYSLSLNIITILVLLAKQHKYVITIFIFVMKIVDILGLFFDFFFAFCQVLRWLLSIDITDIFPRNGNDN